MLTTDLSFFEFIYYFYFALSAREQVYPYENQIFFSEW